MKTKIVTFGEYYLGFLSLVINVYFKDIICLAIMVAVRLMQLFLWLI